jgi:hypothetical protein
MKKSTILVVIIGLVLVAIYRVLIPEANFNPIGAMALMAGALIGHKYLRFILPLSALIIGDLIMMQVAPSYSSYILSSTHLFVFSSFALIVLIGVLVGKRLNLLSVLGGGILASVVFFLVTNAGSWLALPMYSKDFAGLMEAYAAGVPFFRGFFVSQMVFSVAVYGVYYLATSKKRVLA